MIYRKILIIVILFYSIHSHSQTTFYCNSENVKTINNGNLKTIIQNTKNNIWTVNEKQTHLTLEYEENGKTGIDLYEIIDFDIPDDVNSVTYTIIDSKGWKSLFTINLKTRKINWIIGKNKNNILKYYYIEFNVYKIG